MNDDTNTRQTMAREARALVEREREGALGTIFMPDAADVDLAFPFTTWVEYASDPSGAPLLLLSSLAEHTKNLKTSARASLLVKSSAAPHDALAPARVTLVGELAELADDASSRAKAHYLMTHPHAQRYAAFRDFAMFRLDVRWVRYVAGFGRMGFVDAALYATSS
jgi:hypothetical protein